MSLRTIFTAHQKVGLGLAVAVALLLSGRILIKNSCILFLTGARLVSSSFSYFPSKVNRGGASISDDKKL